MRDVCLAAAQFEARDRDKEYNLARIEELTARATREGAEAVSFHECCITGYTFLMSLGKDELLDLAEPVPDGPSTRALIDLAAKEDTHILAGLLERDAGDVYNAYVAVGPQGFLARHRKLHAFVNPHLSSGDSYTLFDFDGVRAGILTCYDNNLPENVRMTTLLGADVVFMPHVTCGLPSPMPGRGKIPREIWENRHEDPVRCRQEFLGPKGRGWLMRWLPARAYENGVYAVFSNAVGIDHDTVKNGNAMILDPYGEILIESNRLGDDVVVACCAEKKLELAPGRRYLRARRPELYGKMSERAEGHLPVTEPGWKLERPSDVGRSETRPEE